MKTSFIFQPFYAQDLVKKAECVGQELNKHLSGKTYTTDIQLDALTLIFINTELMKCRVRSDYRATADPFDPYIFTVMTLFFEIPMPEAEFIKVSDEDRPTYIGKAIMKKLESQNVPTKIRKQFDRERFIADVRDFFVNVKGCKLD